MNISSNMSSSNNHSNNMNSVLHSNMNVSHQRSFTSNQTSRRKSSFYRKKTLNSFDMKSNNRLYKVQFGPHNPLLIDNKKYGNNIIKTTKYNVFTLIPKNLFYQFTRASNVYFLIVSVLTCLSFSPKEPASMIGTFVFVLFFTMCKDAIEDLGRYKQDRKNNNRLVLRFVDDEWVEDQCYKLSPGDIIKIRKEEEFSCDAVIINSSNSGGYLYLDTKNLDGETNLKEKMSLEDLKEFSMNDEDLRSMRGMIETTVSDANLNEWEGIMTYNEMSDVYCCMKNMVLKGCVLKNTSYVYAIVVYAGHHTKIMKNSQNPKPKTSKIIKTMNKIMYSLFGFTIVICIVFAIFSVKFIDKYATVYTYIYPSFDKSKTSNKTIPLFCKNFLVFFIAYAQIIPISLYVAMEIVKVYQAILIKYDADIYDKVLDKPASCRASELIEELGQVDFIFSDKTGTLTQNVMVFKKCFINGKVYGAEGDNNIEEDAERTVNGDLSAFNVLSSGDENEDKEKVHRFFLLLSLCHEVFPEKSEKGILYQGSSPDDIALVKGAQQLGYEFLEKDFNKVTIKDYITNTLTEWEILALIPFDSDRKRMSVIAKEKKTQKIFLLSKGSDGIMLKGVPPHPAVITQYASPQEKININRVLDSFSKEGLRILVMGYKEISQQYFSSWIEKHDAARKRSEDLLKKVYDEVESDLFFVGCSAIEDKLQAGVPETIEILMRCGIRIWVLTGDKQDTAEQIGRQCRLIENSMKLIDLSCDCGNKVELSEKLNKLLDEYDLEEFYQDSKISLQDITKSHQQSPSSNEKLSIIIDGVTLEEVLNDKDLNKMFFLISAISKSVICCRVSPKQKSQVVKLVKNYGDYVTLSIGDGANDVPMILETSIGVGIQGKEGTQAVRSADYAIGQFRYLEKLILFYGRNGYIKISKYICYYFYKNIILVVTELFLAIYNGFSGQVFFADWLGTMFNAIFTSWPCLFTFAYEKEHDVSTCKRFPVLYRAGPQNALFNIKVFWGYITYGLIHSALCFYIPALGLTGYTNDNGTTMNHWRISTISFCLVIHVVSIKLMLISSFWNKITIIFTLFSVVFYYIILVCLCTEFFGQMFQNELVGVYDIFTDLKSWIIIIVAPFAICLPDVLISQLMYTFIPNPSEYIRKYRHSEEMKMLIGKEEAIIKKLSRSFANSMISRHTNDIKDSTHTLPMTKMKKNEDVDNCTNCPLNQMTGSVNVLEELNNNKVNGRGKVKKIKALSLYPEILNKNNQLSEATEVQIDPAGLNEAEEADRKKRLIKKNYGFEELKGNFQLNKTTGNKMNTLPYMNYEMKEMVDGGRSVSSKSPL